MFAAYFQKTRYRVWAAIVALAAAALVTTGWTPSASAEPPAPPPPVDQHADSDEADDSDEAPRQDTSNRRERTSPVVLKKKPISGLRYVLGGLIGSYYGFGIGHAIVGEWGTTGWFYTVSELMSGTVMVVGLYRSLEAAHDPDDGRPRRTSEADQRMNNAMMIGGGITLLVLRISEIHDLWTRPEVASTPRDDDTAFALTPSATDGGLGASFSWSW